MTAKLDPSDVEQYLADNPDFFHEHLPLLAELRLPSPLVGRAVSLQERQIEVLREKYRVLELRLAELVRVAQENDAIAKKYKSWTRALLMARNDVDLPHALIDGLHSVFGVPHVSMRLWGVAEEFAHTWFAQDVGEDARLFANSLTAPYCGANKDFEAVRWLEAENEVKSIALLPLRHEQSSDAFGLLVLGADDSERFTSGMATDFLTDIAETASAAVLALLD